MTADDTDSHDARTDEQTTESGLASIAPLSTGGRSRRRVLGAVAAAGATLLAGCGSGDGGDGGGGGSPEGSDTAAPGEATATDTAAPDEATDSPEEGTPEAAERAQEVITRAESVYGDALDALAQAQVVIVQGNTFELRIAEESDFSPYFDLDTEAQLAPVIEVRQEAEALIEQVEEDATRQAVAELSAIGFYIESKYDQYGNVARAFTNMSRAFNAYSNGEPRAGVSPARTAADQLASVASAQETMSASLEELRTQNDYQAGFDGWSYDYEANIQQFMDRIVFEFTPAGDGLVKLLTGTTVEADGVAAYRDENYGNATAFAQDAGDRYQTSVEGFSVALDREVRYFPSAFDLLNCLADDSRQDVTLLEEAGRQALNDNQSDADDTFSEYQEAAGESSCGSDGSTATPTATPS